MGLLSKLKGKSKEEPQYGTSAHNAAASTSNSGGTSAQPPSYDYGPPSGPPPSSAKQEQAYFAPPPGPPPDFSSHNQQPPQHNWDQPPAFDAGPASYQQYAPPPGPPPTLPGYVDYSNTTPSTTHDPSAPPPVTSQWTSPTSNASEDAAVRGHEFVRYHPIAPPAHMAPEHIAQRDRGEFGLQQPIEFLGEVERTSATVTHIKSRPKNQDALLLSSFPLYSMVADQPREKDKKTIYYEVKILSLGESAAEASVAIGYAAVPYPAWRLPGWHRASIGVHSDDGHRYVNDSYGGREFTMPFRKGDTVGIGMRFRMQRAEAFFVRNGEEKGSWWIDEEVDAEEMQAEGIDNLQGEADLYAAVGIYGGVEVEVDFARKEWSDS